MIENFGMECEFGFRILGLNVSLVLGNLDFRLIFRILSRMLGWF